MENFNERYLTLWKAHLEARWEQDRIQRDEEIRQAQAAARYAVDALVMKMQFQLMTLALFCR